MLLTGGFQGVIIVAGFHSLVVGVLGGLLCRRSARLQALQGLRLVRDLEVLRGRQAWNLGCI